MIINSLLAFFFARQISQGQHGKKTAQEPVRIRNTGEGKLRFFRANTIWHSPLPSGPTGGADVVSRTKRAISIRQGVKSLPLGWVDRV